MLEAAWLEHADHAMSPLRCAAACELRVSCSTDQLIGHSPDNPQRATIVLTIQHERIMEVAIRKMGNSQGVLIPKPILAQVGLEGTADLRVRNGVIEIRPLRRNPREGWADDARRLAAEGDDALVWPEVANAGDADLVW